MAGISLLNYSCNQDVEELSIDMADSQVEALRSDYALEGFTKIVTNSRAYELSAMSKGDIEELKELLDTNYHQNVVDDGQTLYLSDKELSFEEILGQSHSQSKMVKSYKFGWRITLYDGAVPRPGKDAIFNRSGVTVAKNGQAFLMSTNLPRTIRNKASSANVAIKNMSNTIVNRRPVLFLFDKILHSSTRKGRVFGFSDPGEKITIGANSTRVFEMIFGAKFNNRADAFELDMKGGPLR